mgnify:CR=1 FL=1
MHNNKQEDSLKVGYDDIYVQSDEYKYTNLCKNGTVKKNPPSVLPNNKENKHQTISKQP